MQSDADKYGQDSFSYYIDTDASLIDANIRKRIKEITSEKYNYIIHLKEIVEKPERKKKEKPGRKKNKAVKKKT